MPPSAATQGEVDTVAMQDEGNALAPETGFFNNPDEGEFVATDEGGFVATDEGAKTLQQIRLFANRTTERLFIR